MSIKLLNCDCIEYMHSCKKNEFDLAIVDPPYGIGNFVQISGNVRGERVTWNDNIPSDEYFSELKRVSKEQIIWGANYYNCFNGNGGAIVWYKKVNPMSNLSECEIASYSKHKKVSYFESIWQNINRKEETIHPCQKPIKLYKWLLESYADNGEFTRVLDTHLGSGSSAIAAHYFGCDFVGMEIDKDYYNAACERFDRETRQLAMF